ncbi:MAG: carboxypeptidase regulatory-like domain-containing protein [Lentisphaerae bacterium]|nr:carboxypeptidase regulatory-like domain-containing protein [Lentisphaerota bacterium]
MNKKILLITTIMLIASLHCYAQERYSKEYRKALRDGASAKVTIEIKDEINQPVTNASVQAFFRMTSGPNVGKSIKGTSDNNGQFIAEGVTTDIVFIKIEKDGYYTTRAQYIAQSDDPGRLIKGRWLPWNPTIPVVLREVRNPIPMYVKRFEGKFPNGATVGFDCEKGDFVEPRGEGETTDFTVRVTVDGIPYKHTSGTLNIESPDPDGGFSVLNTHADSDFKSEYASPESGYVTNMTATSSYDATKGVAGTGLYGGGECLYFKSRIKRDSDGNVISSNYGKICEEFVFSRHDDGMKDVYVRFLYYFNPTPNDRNLEFDGKNNLFFPQYKTSQYAP